jgi:hypothetical protein
MPWRYGGRSLHSVLETRVLSGIIDLHPIAVVAGATNDLHVYNPASMTWFELPAQFPGAARKSFGFTSAGGKLYVHGGQADIGELSRDQSEHFE